MSVLWGDFTFSVMSSSQESMLSLNKSSVLPWLLLRLLLWSSCLLDPHAYTQKQEQFNHRILSCIAIRHKAIIFWFITQNISSFCVPSSIQIPCWQLNFARGTSHLPLCSVLWMDWTTLQHQLLANYATHTASLHPSILWIYIQCLCIFRSTAVTSERRALTSRGIMRAGAVHPVHPVHPPTQNQKVLV